VTPSSLPALSVIVSNFNGASYLPRLLETLTAQEGVAVEIVVVDRHSTDGSAGILAAWPQVRVLSEPPASGLVSGYAAGVTAASYDLLFFCNEDMWFEKDCLAHLVAALTAPDIGGADPAEWTYDGEQCIHAGTRFVPARVNQNGPDPGRSMDFLVPLPSGSPVAFGCAASWLLRRDAYEDAGGWDRSFFLDVEDLDLGIRLWQRGWRTVAVPDAKVYHAVNVSNAKTVGGVVVGRRRYESSRASVLVIAVKYLPVPRIVWTIALWMAAVIRRVLVGRWRMVWWDVCAWRQFLRRAPAALAYRRTHRALNRARPVMSFFRAPGLQRPPL
jgi:GT2 family glycosyltransferase